MPFLHPSDLIDYTCEIPGSPGRRASTWAILTVCLTAFVTTTDFTIINVALPAIAADLDVGIGDLQWIADSYNIALAGLLLLGAGLGDRFTHRRVFLVGVALFALGSLTGAAAPDAGVLIGARVLMGVSAALLLSPALALLALLCHGHERTRALGLWALMASVGFATGPLLGGVLLTLGSWRLVFLVVVPVLLLILVSGRRSLPDAPATTAAHLDVPGALLSVAALILLLGALIEAPERGWTAPLVVTGFVLGLAVLILFVRWELHTAAPMVDLTLLRNRRVQTALVVFFPTYLSSAGALFIAPQQLMVVSGYSALAVGLALLPLAMVDGALGLRSARIARSVGRRRAIIVGLAAMLVGFVVLALSVTGPVLMVTVLGVVLGTSAMAVGWGLLTPLANAELLDGVPATMTGSGSGIGALGRFLGSSVGVALFGSLLALTYGRQITAAFAAAGVPVGEVPGSPAAAQTAIGMLPAQQAAIIRPEALVAFADAVQWTYWFGAAVMAAFLVGYLMLSGRDGRDRSTEAA